jgi:uncharacterized protein DUF4062/FHA domain-containing protein
MVQVFLSSTARDLSECRELAYHAIEGLAGYHCVRMEDFGAWDIASDELCGQRVAACDLFVILAGPLYGSTLESGKSYTEREYDIAESLNIPRLCFLTSDDFLIPAALSESASNRRKQGALRRRLGDTRTFKRFKSASELATMVVQAVHNWEASPTEHSLVRVARGGSGGTREYRRPFLRLGRNPESEVSISDDPDVSWDHGVIFKHAGEFYYRHLSETNPAWITAGPRQVVLQPAEKQEVMLQARNEVRIGNSKLAVDVLVSGGKQKVVPTNKQDQDG